MNSRSNILICNKNSLINTVFCFCFFVFIEVFPYKCVKVKKAANDYKNLNIRY